MPDRAAAAVRRLPDRVRGYRSRVASRRPASNRTFARLVRAPAGARKKAGRSPVSSVNVRCAASISRLSAPMPVTENVCTCFCEWFSTLCPRAIISRVSAGWRRARSPIRKNVARTRCASSRSRTWGVTTGSGPSSSVSAMAFALRGMAGKRVQLGPSSVERGHSPAAVNVAWLTAVPASHHGLRLPSLMPITGYTLAKSSPAGRGCKPASLPASGARRPRRSLATHESSGTTQP